MEVNVCLFQSRIPPSKSECVVPVHFSVSSSLHLAFNTIILQAFSLTFLAEWGDRSQIATIALAASRNVWGVNIGAILGHGLCTGIAVVGGKILASSISERAVAFAGGSLFLVFAFAGVLFDV